MGVVHVYLIAEISAIDIHGPCEHPLRERTSTRIRGNEVAGLSEEPSVMKKE